MLPGYPAGEAAMLPCYPTTHGPYQTLPPRSEETAGSSSEPRESRTCVGVVGPKRARSNAHLLRSPVSTPGQSGTPGPHPGRSGPFCLDFSAASPDLRG
jgi:hypothetical protein